MDKNAGIHKDLVDSADNSRKNKKKKKKGGDDENNSDESNSSSEEEMNTSLQSIKSKNSFFDPPIENYRFYYQGGGAGLQPQAYQTASFKGSVSGSRSDNYRAGLILRQQRSGNRNLDEDTNTDDDTSRGTFIENNKKRKELFGSIASNSMLENQE